MLIAGGINGTTSLNTAQLYNPTAGTWAAAGNLNAARHGHTATLLADGRVLVAGGLNGTTHAGDGRDLQPGLRVRELGGDDRPIPPTGQKNHTAMLLRRRNQQLNNKVLIVGGNSGSATLSAVVPVRPRAVGVQHAGVDAGRARGSHDDRARERQGAGDGRQERLDDARDDGDLRSRLRAGLVVDGGNDDGGAEGHTATLLPASIVANGQVLVAGGSSGSATLALAGAVQRDQHLDGDAGDAGAAVAGPHGDAARRTARC